MGKFTFIKNTDDIETSDYLKEFAVPSPDKDYILVMKYYRYRQLSEGDYQTRDFPNFYSELFLYIRKKDENTFFFFFFFWNVWVHRHIENSILYDDIMNLAEVSTDVQNEWSYLVGFVKQENAPE